MAATIFFILVRLINGKALILDGATQRAETLTQEAFEAIWGGSLILIKNRANLSDLGGAFNLSWFIGAIPNTAGCWSKSCWPPSC